MSSVVVPASLELNLPSGWCEHANPDGPREFRASVDGSAGVLQVHQFGLHDFELISQQPDLGAFAIEMGYQLGAKGQNWGRAAAGRQGECAFGRFGFAMFQGGSFPAMFLWITVSSDSALMWTWFGPSPVADEVKSALRIVLEARCLHS